MDAISAYLVYQRYPSLDRSVGLHNCHHGRIEHTFASQNLSLHDNNYILAGPFRSLSIFLLTFSPSARTLTRVKRSPNEFGPHQFLAKVYESRHDGISGETKEMRIYGTSWGWPPMLYCRGLTSTPSGDRNAWNIGQKY
jgi:hypothetical protein